MKTPEVLLKEIVEALGYLSADDFENVTRCTLEISDNVTAYRYNMIFISHKDGFAKSYTDSSTTSIDKDSRTEGYPIKTSIIDEIKRKVKSKVTQLRKIDAIKERAVKDIIVFINETFDIPLKYIDREDISFQQYSRFSFAGRSFGYSGTLIRNEFQITTYVYGEVKYFYEKMRDIRAYYAVKSKNELLDFSL